MNSKCFIKAHLVRMHFISLLYKCSNHIAETVVSDCDDERDNSDFITVDETRDQNLKIIKFFMNLK